MCALELVVARIVVNDICMVRLSYRMERPSCPRLAIHNFHNRPTPISIVHSQGAYRACIWETALDQEACRHEPTPPAKTLPR